jgi:hypothetical protein
MKGFDVATCPWRKPEIALAQLDDMVRFRASSAPKMKQHFQGIIATVWSGAENFLESYYDPETHTRAESDAITLKRLIEAYKKL